MDDDDRLLVTLKLHPEGDVGEWLVKHSHASFASIGSLSPPSLPVDHTSPVTNHSSTLIDHADSLVDHSSQSGNDSLLYIHSPTVMEEHEASQCNDAGPACESGQ